MISFKELMKYLRGKSKAKQKEHVTMPPQGDHLFDRPIRKSRHSGRAAKKSSDRRGGPLTARNMIRKKKAARRNQRAMHRIRACRPTY